MANLTLLTNGVLPSSSIKSLFHILMITSTLSGTTVYPSSVNMPQNFQTVATNGIFWDLTSDCDFSVSQRQLSVYWGLHAQMRQIPGGRQDCKKGCWRSPKMLSIILIKDAGLLQRPCGILLSKQNIILPRSLYHPAGFPGCGGTCCCGPAWSLLPTLEQDILFFPV